MQIVCFKLAFEHEGLICLLSHSDTTCRTTSGRISTRPSTTGWQPSATTGGSWAAISPTWPTWWGSSTCFYSFIIKKTRAHLLVCPQAVFGVLRAMEGLQAFHDMMNNTKVKHWYKRMETATLNHEGRLQSKQWTTNGPWLASGNQIRFVYRS